MLLMMMMMMMFLVMLVMFWDSLPCELCLRAGSKSTLAGPQDNEDPVFSSPCVFFPLLTQGIAALNFKVLTRFIYLSFSPPPGRGENLNEAGVSDCGTDPSLPWRSQLQEVKLPLIATSSRFRKPPTFSLPFKSAPKLNSPAARLKESVLLHSVGPFPFSFPFLSSFHARLRSEGNY